MHDPIEEQLFRECASGVPFLDPRLGREVVGTLLRRVAPDRLDTVVGAVLQGTVTTMWQGGWMPTDLAAAARRTIPTGGHTLVVDTIAAYHHRVPRSSLHHRWAAQLDELAATVWWDDRSPHLGQWRTRHDVDPLTAVYLAALVAGLGHRLPRLPVIVPPPTGSSTVSPDSSVRSADPQRARHMERVRALLAKAESTEFAEEAEALSAKAQELMTRYSIEVALDVDAGPATTARRLWLDAPYIRAKSTLVAQVAAANHCRVVTIDGLGLVTIMGDASDVDAVELLSTSLMVQATSAMLTAARVHSAQTSRTKSFRRSFLLAYGQRIGERLSEAAHSAARSVGSDLVPVFAARELAADRMLESLFPDVRHSTSRVSNGAGWAAGRAAADQARLGKDRDVLT